MGNADCKLQMNQLYFSKFDFAYDGKEEDTDYRTSFQIEYAVNRKDASKFRITIDTSVKNKSESIVLNLQTVGVFTIVNDGDDTNNDIDEHLIKVNTVAIMLPFIRSQISLLTAQPGLKPVLLPPININALMEPQKG